MFHVKCLTSVAVIRGEVAGDRQISGACHPAVLA
jgi:hypothetical protein